MELGNKKGNSGVAPGLPTANHLYTSPYSHPLNKPTTKQIGTPNTATYPYLSLPCSYKKPLARIEPLRRAASNPETGQ